MHAEARRGHRMSCSITVTLFPPDRQSLTEPGDRLVTSKAWCSSLPLLTRLHYHCWESHFGMFVMLSEAKYMWPHSASYESCKSELRLLLCSCSKSSHTMSHLFCLKMCFRQRERDWYILVDILHFHRSTCIDCTEVFWQICQLCIICGQQAKFPPEETLTVWATSTSRIHWRHSICLLAALCAEE